MVWRCCRGRVQRPEPAVGGDDAVVAVPQQMGQIHGQFGVVYHDDVRAGGAVQVYQIRPQSQPDAVRAQDGQLANGCGLKGSAHRAFLLVRNSASGSSRGLRAPAVSHRMQDVVPQQSAAIADCQDERQRPALTIGGEVNLAGQSAAGPSDLIKNLTERIGATFVYAGIDVTTTPLFTGVRGAQLAGRASLIDCAAFPARLGDEEPFRDLITAMESALDLRRHRPGTLPKLAPYLHERTAGRIGSLARLIRQAAITALTDGTDGTERITKTTLDAIRLDHLAEQHYRPHTRPRSTNSP
jgi:hypothetical protein